MRRRPRKRPWKPAGAKIEALPLVFEAGWFEVYTEPGGAFLGIFDRCWLLTSWLASRPAGCMYRVVHRASDMGEAWGIAGRWLAIPVAGERARLVPVERFGAREA